MLSAKGYKVVDIIGKGVYGKVYLVCIKQNVMNGSIVEKFYAMKHYSNAKNVKQQILRPKNDAALDKIWSEINIMKKVDHANVVYLKEVQYVTKSLAIDTTSKTIGRY